MSEKLFSFLVNKNILKVIALYILKDLSQGVWPGIASQTDQLLNHCQNRLGYQVFLVSYVYKRCFNVQFTETYGFNARDNQGFHLSTIFVLIYINDPPPPPNSSDL